MIKPLGKNIVVCLEKLESKSGIILEKVVGVVEPIGEVLAVGSDESIKVQIGDRVCFDPSGLYQLKVDGSEYSMLSYSAVIAILPEKSLIK